MKILIISDNYPPEKNALANRAFAISNYLSKFYETTVLTCFPNYPYGKICNKYKTNNFYKKEIFNNVSIIRLKSYIAKKNNGILNFLDYLSFGINSFIYSIFKKKDLIIASSPPLPVAFFSILVSRITFTPCILEIRDIWSDSILELEITKSQLIIFFLRLIEKLSYLMANKIYCVTDTMKKILISRGVNSNKIFIRPNGYIKKDYQFRKSRIIRHFAKFKKYTNFTFIGTVGESQDFETLIEIAKFFKNKNIIFNIIGSGSKFEWLKKKIQDQKLNNVFLFKQIENSNNYEIYKNINYFFSFLKQIKVFESVIPSKLYDNIYHKKFTLFFGPKGEASNFLRKNHLGFPVHNKAGLINKIKFLEKSKISFPITNTQKFSRNFVSSKIIEDISELIK